MSTKVFGVRIYLDDHAAPVTADAAIGLYAVTSNLASNAASGQADVIVADGTIFTAGEIVTVTDTADSEDAIILSIATNSLTMTANLTNAYTTARSAKVNANSRFRWVQNTISTVTTWKEGIIVAGGIRPYSREIDLSHGGNIASPGKSEVVVKNTNQFFDTVFDKGIYLNGLKCEIVLFTDATSAVQWTGTCENPTWDTREYSIPLSGYYSRRVANIGTIITEAGYPDASGDAVGKNIPVTIGKFVPAFDSFGNIIRPSLARFDRVSSKETQFISSAYVGGDPSAGDPPGFIDGGDYNRTSFNFVESEDGLTPSKKLIFRLYYTSPPGEVVYLSYADTEYTYFAGKFLHIVSGKGSGEWRKITKATWKLAAIAGVGGFVFEIDIAPKEMYIGQALGRITDCTWTEIRDIVWEYYCDSVKCRAYLDSIGTEITDNLNVYTYDNSQRVDVTGDAETASVYSANFGFKIVSTSAVESISLVNKNGVKLNPKYPSQNVGSLNDFKYMFYDLSTLVLHDATTLTSADIDGDTTWSKYDGSGRVGLYQHEDDDLFKGDYSTDLTTTSSEQRTAVATINDFPETSDIRSTLALSFPRPLITEDIEFESVYILVAIQNTIVMANSDLNSSVFKIRAIRRLGYAFDCLSISPATSLDKDLSVVRNLPLSASATWGDDSKFYFHNTLSGGSVDEVNGYERFQISGVTNMSDFKSIDKFLFILQSNVNYDTGTGDNQFFISMLGKIGFAFRIKKNIEKSIYMPHSGRIYNDTWGGGRGFTAADAIVNPHRILEHVCRLQNWSENSISPTGGWGKGYAANALIKTGVADGSFDDATDGDYAFITGMECAAQLLTNDECYTDTIKRTICRDFFLANWTGADGYEKVKRIKRSTTATADALTLASIVDRQSIRIQEPTPNDIYPEPFVRYNKNPATGEYESAMRITNVSGTYAAASVEGLSGTDASTYWTRCNTLWKRCRHLNKPPTDLTDLTWANGAQADDIAKEYLTCWIDWMYNASITLKVPFAIAGAWEECHRFTINLPHQTNNVAIECMLTEITVDPNPPYYVTIRALMFSESIPADFNIRKTLTAFGTDDGDWVKTLTAYSNDNDILKVT